MVKCLLCSAVVLAGLVAAGPDGAVAAAGSSRFFFSGDGWIHLTSEKSRHVFRGRYRDAEGRYTAGAMKQIHRVFGAPYEPPRLNVSLRLIEYLDFLEDRHLRGARIRIASGYRNPTYNTALREQGRLAAKASLHQYGMAADVILQGVSSLRIWKDVKTLGFGGTGYYQGETVHIDVGPARSWDQTSSGVGTGISDDNKLIGLVTDYDRYRAGDPILLRFIRMTGFPIGVNPEFELVAADHRQRPSTLFRPVFAVAADTACPAFKSIDQMAFIRWRLPRQMSPGRYRIRATFCNRTYPDMPPQVATPVFEIGAALHKPR
jgi:uncharacterized protein YcbK (DUF882 family)